MTPLVLALEPDVRQAAILKRVMHDHVQADLTIVDSRDGALAAIAERLPDVILLTALLSPRDEEELFAHLRGRADAEHVQTHSLPQLAHVATLPEERSASKGSLFGKLRRRKAEPEPIAGCSPELFAQEINAYLQRAAELKAEAGASKPAVDVAPRAQAAGHLDSLIEPQPPTADQPAASSWSSPFEWRPTSDSRALTLAAAAEPAMAEGAAADERDRRAQERERQHEQEKEHDKQERDAERRRFEAEREAERLRVDTERQAIEAERQRIEAERQQMEAEAAAARERETERLRLEAERQKTEAERQRVDAERERERVRQEAEREAARLREDAERQRDAAKRQAEAAAAREREAERLRLEAEREKERLRVEAEREKERVRVEAEREAARLRQEAERQKEAAERQKEAAEREAERRKKEAEEARRERERVRLEAEREAAALREQAEIEAERLRLEAEIENERRLEEVAREAERIRLEAEAHASRMRAEDEARRREEDARRRSEERAARDSEKARKRSAERAAERARKHREAVQDAFAEFRLEAVEQPIGAVRLVPLAVWARIEKPRAEEPPPSGRDDLRELMKGLSIPLQVAGITYARGCRIRRVRVPALPASARKGSKDPVILSRRALDEIRSLGAG